MAEHADTASPGARRHQRWRTGLRPTANFLPRRTAARRRPGRSSCCRSNDWSFLAR